MGWISSASISASPIEVDACTVIDRSGAVIARDERKGDGPSDHVPVVVDLIREGDEDDPSAHVGLDQILGFDRIVGFTRFIDVLG